MAVLGYLVSNEVNFRNRTEETRGQTYVPKILRLYAVLQMGQEKTNMLYIVRLVSNGFTSFPELLYLCFADR